MSANTKKRILLIGAGPTGALISYNIAKNKILQDALDVHVWDKARGIGGRFSTSRSSKNPNPDCYADLGAQYLTLSQQHRSSNAYFENLRQNNLIRPLDTENIPGFRSNPTTRHFACVKGSASIVKHFFEQASISKNDISFNDRVIKITPVPSGKVEVSAETGKKDTFDLVISTMPAPQLLQLENFSGLLTDKGLQKSLEVVKYSTRFALGIFFDAEIHLKCSDKPINFVENDSMIRYWSIENLKRSGKYADPTSAVIHTSVDFGAKNIEVDKEIMKPQLLQRAIETVIPEAADIPSDAVKSHKWRYSQVSEAYPGKPGCVKISNQILAAGDSFSGSGFEGCIDSAEKTIEIIKSVMNL